MIGTQMKQPDALAIRSVCASDLAALSDFFAGLSPQSRYLRFFAPVTPRPELLSRMSGGDGHTDAVIAVREGVIIGHAMAADLAGPPGVMTADVGVVVADAWQGLGVGSALMRALITSAQDRGVTSLTMEVLPGNRKMRAMIAHWWPAARVEASADFVTFRVRLRPHRQQRPQAQPAALAPAA